MRAIGLDLGSKTLGIATSDMSKTIASSYKTIRFYTDDYDSAIEQLKVVLDELKPDTIVLGLPKNMDGSLGFQAQKTIDFKEKINKELEREVIFVDERMTSKMAHSVMIKADLSRKKRKQKVDKLAATLILQSYLDSRK